MLHSLTPFLLLSALCCFASAAAPAAADPDVFLLAWGNNIVGISGEGYTASTIGTLSGASEPSLLACTSEAFYTVEGGNIVEYQRSDLDAGGRVVAKVSYDLVMSIGVANGTLLWVSRDLQANSIVEGIDIATGKLTATTWWADAAPGGGGPVDSMHYVYTTGFQKGVICTLDDGCEEMAIEGVPESYLVEDMRTSGAFAVAQFYLNLTDFPDGDPDERHVVVGVVDVEAKTWRSTGMDWTLHIDKWQATDVNGAAWDGKHVWSAELSGGVFAASGSDKEAKAIYGMDHHSIMGLCMPVGI